MARHSLVKATTEFWTRITETSYLMSGVSFLLRTHFCLLKLLSLVLYFCAFFKHICVYLPGHICLDIKEIAFLRSTVVFIGCFCSYRLGSWRFFEDSHVIFLVKSLVKKQTNSELLV